MRLIGALLAVGLLGACQPEDVPNADPGPDTVAGLADVEAVCSIVSDKYAYFEAREDNWGAACDQAKASIANAETSTDRLFVIETLLDALYDPHINLNTNSGRSPRLVPSGADYWIELGEVVSVRQGGSAAGAGLTVGDRILDINGQQMTEAAIERVQPEGVNASAAQLDWALNAAAAGYRDVPRQVTVARPGGAKTFDLGEPQPEWPGEFVTAERIDDVLHLRINNSLGDDGAGDAFLAELDKHTGVSGIVIDLRDTPGGGGTDNAEPMMGAFFSAPIEYQRILPKDAEPYNRRLETISAKFVDEPIVVLVGRWTGSMGEGMAVGFDGTGRARVMGSPMAGLAGGMKVFALPESSVSLRMPVYDLAHLNGTPRYNWVPPHEVLADNGDDEDVALSAALAWLAEQPSD